MGQPLVAMVALKNFAHEGVPFEPGDHFEVIPVQAAVLQYARTARFAEPGERMVLTAEPPKPMTAPKTRHARKTSGRRRQYKTKALTTV